MKGRSDLCEGEHIEWGQEHVMCTYCVNFHVGGCCPSAASTIFSIYGLPDPARSMLYPLWEAVPVPTSYPTLGDCEYRVSGSHCNFADIRRVGMQEVVWPF